MIPKCRLKTIKKKFKYTTTEPKLKMKKILRFFVVRFCNLITSMWLIMCTYMIRVTLSTWQPNRISHSFFWVLFLFSWKYSFIASLFCGDFFVCFYLFIFFSPSFSLHYCNRGQNYTSTTHRSICMTWRCFAIHKTVLKTWFFWNFFFK